MPGMYRICCECAVFDKYLAFSTLFSTAEIAYSNSAECEISTAHKQDPMVRDLGRAVLDDISTPPFTRILKILPNITGVDMADAGKISELDMYSLAEDPPERLLFQHNNYATYSSLRPNLTALKLFAWVKSGMDEMRSRWEIQQPNAVETQLKSRSNKKEIADRTQDGNPTPLTKLALNLNGQYG
ncbi:hypothetical protein C8R45DRAFT_931636 [Mycena sanguinolenta]|nr:hypothetical protein C8R45DRAFT_931636 [Mycena sanguinolenta]